MSVESCADNEKTVTRGFTYEKDLNEFDHRYGIIDAPTPKHVPLSGQYKRSFAYYTFRQRLPNTLNNVLKSLEEIRSKDELGFSLVELNFVVNQIVQLKQQLETDGRLEMFNGNEPDKEIWNAFIDTIPKDKCTFYRTCWLYAECYMYRKLASFFEATQTMRDYDYFGQQKFNALKLANEVMERVAESTKNSVNNKQTFTRLLKLNLWSNRCDLSITSGQEIRPTVNLLEQIDNLNSNILIDDSEQIWNSLQRSCDHVNLSSTPPVIVDFICDNAGFELFTDLLMAQYLIEHRLADTVRFNVKTIPWYISDTTVNDVRGTLKYLQEQKSPEFKRLGSEWSRCFKDGQFQLASLDHFWTSPYEYHSVIFQRRNYCSQHIDLNIQRDETPFPKKTKVPQKSGIFSKTLSLSVSKLAVNHQQSETVKYKCCKIHIKRQQFKVIIISQLAINKEFKTNFLNPLKEKKKMFGNKFFIFIIMALMALTTRMAAAEPFVDRNQRPKPLTIPRVPPIITPPFNPNARPTWQ